MNITPLTDDPTKTYTEAIRSAKNRAELVYNIMPFKRVADDALKCAKKFTDYDFDDFKRDLKKAKKCDDVKWCDAFNERFGDIAMPRKLMLSSMMADQYKVPWGMAFLRLEDNGFDF